jgi:glycosyltransferase 2 family protein
MATRLSRTAGGAARIAISAALLAWIFATRDLDPVFAALSRCSGPLLLASLAVHVSALALNGLRLAWLLRTQGQPAPLRAVLFVHLTSFFFDLVAPGTVAGDLTRVVSLSSGLRTAAASAHTVLLWRVTGSIPMSLLGAIGGLVVWRYRPSVWLLALPATFLLFSIGLVGLLTWDRLYRYAIRWTRGWPWLAGRMEDLAASAADARRTPRTLPLSVLFALAGQFVVMFAWTLAARAVGAAIGFPAFVAVVPIIGMLRILPVSMQGIGLREAGAAMVLGVLGHAEADALAVALIISSQLIVISLAGGLLSLLAGVIRLARRDGAGSRA